MKQRNMIASQGRPQAMAAGAALLGVALLLRFPGMIEPRFWQDEMISLSIAGGSFIESIIGTLRFSAHPPAYYAQLNLWMLGGKDESYIILNSVLWSVAGVGALYYLGRKIIGEKAAALAALLLAVMPMSLYFAQNARMYAMISLFQIVGWFAAERIAAQRAEQEGAARAHYMILFLSQIMIGFSHGIGPIFSACLGLFGLARMFEAKAPQPEIIKYVIIQAATGVILILVLINGLLRETQHMPPESLSSLLSMLTMVLFGPKSDAGVFTPVAILIFTACAATAIFVPRLRMMALMLVVLPIGASILTTLAYKPILSERPLALSLPFIALCLAGLLSQAYKVAHSRWLRGGAIAAGLLIGVSFFASAVIFIRTYEKPHDFRAAAADLARNVKPRDCIVMLESNTIFWGLSWYLLGHDSVSSLTIQPPPNEKWQSMYGRLGPELVNSLGLKPKADRLMWNETPLIMGKQGLEQAGTCDRFWLASYQAEIETKAAEPLLQQGFVKAESNSYRGVILSLYNRAH